MSYEIFEHTADLGIRILGTSYDEIFNGAVDAFADLILDKNILTAELEHKIEIKSTNPGFVLVDLLSDILLELEIADILYFSPELKYDEKRVSLTGKIHGGAVPTDLKYRNGIKAVTYHGVEVSPGKGYASVIFDI